MSERRIERKVETFGDLVKALATYQGVASTRFSTWPIVQYENFQTPKITELLLGHFGLSESRELQSVPRDTPVPWELVSRVMDVLKTAA